MQVRGGGAAAGQQERAQRLQLGVDLVATTLEPGDLLGRGAQAILALVLGVVGDREVGSEVEQVVLDPLQPRTEPVRKVALDQRDPEQAVELVDVAVGLDPRVGLGDPAHVPEVGLAGVAGARVDPGQVDRHRLTLARVGRRGG